MAQFVNKVRDCMRTVNLTMLLVLNLFFIVTLNLTVVTVLVVFEADHGFFIQDGSVSIGGALVILYASCILMAISLVVAIRLVLIKPIKNIMQAKKILIVVNGENKADIVERAFFGPVTPEVPASILQLHNDVTLVGDEAALAKIEI